MTPADIAPAAPLPASTSMTSPRHTIVPPGQPGVWHCYSRCVRRALLCGDDPLSGRSFEHRKQWLVDRIFELANLYAVAIHSYAIMGNHFHIVVQLDPPATAQWSDEDVARRWLALSTTSNSNFDSKLAALTHDHQRLETLRQRLGSLSWFMRHLKEPIARRANREDKCTGHFWEKRFDSKVLLDDCALLGTMVYVDLNPLRAGLVSTPELATYASASKRAKHLHQPQQPLQPLAASIRTQLPDISTRSYLELLEWTARSLHPDKPGRIPPNAPPVLQRLAMRPAQWLAHVPATQHRYHRAVGRLDALLQYARRTNTKSLRGIGVAREIERTPEPG